MIKKLSTLLITICALIMLSACGNSTEKEPVQTEVYNGIYTVTELSELNDIINNDNVYLLDYIMLNDKIKCITEEYTNNSVIVKCLVANLDGTIENKYILNDTSKSSSKDCYAYRLMSDGRVIYIENIIENSGNTVNLIEITNEENKITHDVTKYISDGMFINSISESPDKNLYLVGNDKILHIILNDDSITTIDVENCNTLTTPLKYNGVNPVFLVWDSSNESHSLVEIDITNGNIAKNTEIDIDLNEFSIIRTRNTDNIIITSSDALYTYSIESRKNDLMLDYINSSLYASSFKSISVVDANVFIGEYTEDDTFKSKLAIFTKDDNDGAISSEKITLAAISSTSELKRGIINYNNSQSEYRIELIDCKNNIENFNNNIENGSADIIYIDDSINIDEHCINNKVLNLYDIIKNDKSFSKKDYATNFFEAYEINDKLYQIPTKVYISTLLGKGSIFSEYDGITWDELNTLKNEYTGIDILTNKSESDWFKESIKFIYHDCIDISKKSVDFTTKDFESLLEFCKKESDTDIDDTESNTNSTEYEIISGNTLLTHATITSIFDAWAYGYRTFGEESCIVGFPCETKDGSVVSAVSSFAILNNTDNSEQCWNFIKLMLSEEYQNGAETRMYASNSLPVLKSAIQLQIDTLKGKPFYIDSDGKRTEYKNSFMINNTVIEMNPASEDIANKWMQFVLGVNKRSGSGYTEEIKMITNAVERYFSDNCTAEEASIAVQSYMSEYIQNTDEN